MKQMKQMLSLLLAICMVIGIMPTQQVSASVAESTSDTVSNTEANGNNDEQIENAVQINTTSGSAITSSGGELYITEIYPNDIDRKTIYGNTSDHMEYVELTNTSGSAIRFNEAYELYYEYPSGQTYVQKLLNVKAVDGSADITIDSGESVVLWSRRDDIENHASEAEFRNNWLIPNDVKVFVVSGQNGFAEDDRGFSIKNKATGEVVSHYRYFTGDDTSDGLAVHLAIPDFGSDMIPSIKNTYGNPGQVYKEQLNQNNAAPEELKPQGLYITEIRPNDVDRSTAYGTSDDYMEALELFNTTDRDINFNEEYELAYLYKATAYPQPVTTVENAVNNTTSDTSGVIIPANGSAIIWCYRAHALTGYTSFPTLDDFREAYELSENIPVYAQTGQSGWGNTDRGFALLKKNDDGSRTNVSYFFWNGVTDLKDNKSVELKVSADGPKMSIYKAQSTSNLGIVAEEQYTFYEDDNTFPELRLLDESSTVNEGNFLRIPYEFAGTDALPVKSIDFYYRTDNQDTYTLVSTSSFSIYNKYYAFIDNYELLGADYVEYYLKVNNAYRSTTTDVRRINIIKNDDYSGLRVNIDGTEAGNDVVISGKTNISAKNFGDTASEISFSIDENQVTGLPSLERHAYFTFDYNGVDAYFKNGLTTGDKVISVFAKCSEIPAVDSLAIPVSQSLFTYNEDGSANIELTMHAGTYGSTWEADTAANNDDFTAGNFKLQLTDGTILSPVTTVDMKGAVIDPTVMTKMGDSANCTIRIAMTFTIPAEKIDASAFVLDTTTLTDGNHTLSVKSGSNIRDINLVVDNSIPEEQEVKTIDVNVAMSINNAEAASASVSTNSDVKNVTVYKAKAIDEISVKEGAGDSTFAASEKTNMEATVSADGNYPYQMLEIPVNDESIDALRIEVEAQVNYSQPIQLYILNTDENTWELIENISENNGVITAVCQLEGHVESGTAKVLIQARGTEHTPYTGQDEFKTTKNDYVWEGTEIPEQYDFSLAWISDTQYYAEQYTDNFTAVTDWIVDNAEELGIEYIVHTGDIVDEFNEEYQYINADNELRKFETANIPYGVLAGNHDVAHGNMRYELYWKYFGEDRYSSNQVYGESYNNNLGHYDLVTVDGEELLFVYMSWDIYYPETEWINNVLAKYPDRKAIISIHGGIDAKGTQSYASNFLLENVCKENKNVIAIINGHYHGSSLNFVGFDDNGDGIDDRTVYQICTDYQSAEGGGSGYIKMVYFDLNNDKVYFHSYSPVLKDFNYFDTPKLEGYGVGTLAYDIDIAELPIDFNRDVQKSLNVSSVSVSGLTSDELGDAERSDSVTKVNMNIQANDIVGNKINVYAILKDNEGNILGYTDIISFKPIVDNDSDNDSDDDNGSDDDDSDNNTDSPSSNDTTDNSNGNSTTNNNENIPSIEAFNDVPRNAWYYDAVTFIAKQGITNGTSKGVFSPEGTLTRGQFIVMLMRAYGISPDENFTNNFSDAGNTYYTNYLSAAKKLGITNGTGNNKFMPESNINRQDMFTLLYRALSVLGKLPTSNTEVSVDSFSDADEISDYAKQAINALASAGIVSGSNGNINPMDNSTRAQMAQILYNLLSK